MITQMVSIAVLKENDLLSFERGLWVTLRDADSPSYPGHWQCPGARVAEGESTRQAAIRVMQNSAGLVSAPTHLSWQGSRDLQTPKGFPYLAHLFLLFLPPGFSPKNTLQAAVSAWYYKPCIKLNEPNVKRVPTLDWALRIHMREAPEVELPKENTLADKIRESLGEQFGET